MLVICLWGLGKFRICILCCLQLIVCGNCVQECEAARMRPCARTVYKNAKAARMRPCARTVYKNAKAARMRPCARTV